MPIYDYRCLDCGRVAELLVRGSGADGLRCPSCQGEHLEKLPSAGHHLAASHGNGGHTCCGREERCATPPCSTGGSCCHG